MLEVIVSDQAYDHNAVVEAVKNTVAAMKNPAEGGAAE